MNHLLTMKIDLNIKDGSFEVTSDVKDEHRKEFLSDYLRSKMGAGEDTREPENHDVYHITIQLDTADDTFKVSSNTGNNGLREGIVMDVLRRLK